MSARSQTLSRKQLRRLLRAEPADPELRRLMAEAELARPRRRADCIGGPRPCPWLTCRFHLAFDVTPAGGLKENFPGVALEDMAETCALDVADRGGITLEEVGSLFNLTRERIRQMETRALHSLAVRLEEPPCPASPKSGVHPQMTLTSANSTGGG